MNVAQGKFTRIFTGGVAKNCSRESSAPDRLRVDFAAQCYGQKLGVRDGATLVSAVYSLCLPVFALFATFLLCSMVVYVVVPLAGRMGFQFKKASKRKSPAASEAITKSSIDLAIYCSLDLEGASLCRSGRSFVDHSQ